MASGRRDILKGLAITGAFASTRANAAPAATKTGLSPASCQGLTGLSFDAAEQRQMLGALEESVERARAIAQLRLDNALPPAELFNPCFPGWQPRPPAGSAASTPHLPQRPDTGEAIAFAPAWQQAGWIAAQRLGARELVDIYLGRIADRAPRLQCIATLTADQARAEATVLDRETAAGKSRGPLHGLPYGLKDLIDTAGIRTAWGAEPCRDRVPAHDATIVQRLREAGAVLIAKTTCGALAYGDIWYGGRTRNPWNIEEGSSGSSAGSAAAVADGLCSFAIGTETMGSIIAPAARCGTVGLRPTFGHVPRTGAMALCWSLDKIGVLARDTIDTHAVLSAIHGHDGEDPCAVDQRVSPRPAIDPATVTIGYRPEWFANGPATDRRALEAARRAGFRLVEIDLPATDIALLGGIVALESAAAFRELTADGRDATLAWQDDIAWPNTWRAAQFETAVNYIQAQRVRRKLMVEFAHGMHCVDAILHPNDAGGLLPIGNFCGYPALILPVGMIDQPTREGFTDYIAPEHVAPGAKLHKVPFGITLTGHLFDEARLISIGGEIVSGLG